MTNFLNSPTFSIAYYLFTFIAIEAAAFIAYDHWRRNLSLVARRFAIGFGLLGGVRLLFMLFGGAIHPQIANHAAVVVSLGFLAWNFAPYLISRGGTSLLLLAGSTFLALIVFGIHAAISPASGLYIFWLLWALIVTVLIAIDLFRQINQTRVMAIICFVILAIGSLLQLILGAQRLDFVRLTEMIAYPILAVAVYQLVIESLNLSNRESEDITKASVQQTERLVSLFDTTKAITSSLDLAQVLDGAVRGVVETVKVDLCAIALPEESAANQLRMVSTYNPKRAGRGEAVTFPINDQPAIKYTLERQREIEITQGFDTPAFKFLFAMLGAQDEVGPLVIHPLPSRNAPTGVLIVGNPYSKEPFGPTKLQLIRTIVDQIAVTIDNARDYQMLTTKSQQLAWTLRNHEQDSSRRQAAMEAELKKSREEVTIISQRLYEQDTITRKSQKQLTEFQQQISQLNKQLKQAQDAQYLLELEKRETAALTDAQEKQLANVKAQETELAELRRYVSALEVKAAESDKLNQDLLKTQERSQKLAHALKISRAKIQQLAGMPTSVTSPHAYAELEHLSFGLLISDREGKINRVNEAATGLLKLTSADLVGKPLAEVSDDNKWLQAINKTGINDDGLIQISFMVDDNVLKASISPLTTSNGNDISGNVIILYDATEEFESQRARDEFVASLSQELRTPMTSMAGYVDLLLGESVGIIAETQRKFLQRVKANIERMELMLRDLIGVTAIDAGQYDIRPVSLDIAEVIEEALILIKSQIAEKEIELHQNIPMELPPIEVDPDCIRQVIVNLLGNAIEVTPVNGEVQLIVTVTSETHPAQTEELRWLQITVTDSGGGIAEKDIDRVFDRFYEAEQPLIHGLGETGVGLSIVKYLIEAHSGKVWLDTEIGVGSSFHIALQVKDYYNDPWEDLDVPPLDVV